MTGRDGLKERRAHPRARTLKGAQIVYQNGNCVMDCLVADLSDRAARLKPADVFACPDTFELRLKGGPRRRCRIVRRAGAFVVAEFFDDSAGR